MKWSTSQAVLSDCYYAGYNARWHKIGNGEYVVIVTLPDYEIFLWTIEDYTLLRQGLLELDGEYYARERERNKKRDRVRSRKKTPR